MRWKLTIEYDGTPYAGWQRQNSGVRTVQGALERAIAAFSGRQAELFVAGRTDAGVHARGQVAHVDLDPGKKPMSGFEMVKAINAHLREAGESVAVLSAEIVDERFHARFSATNKLYLYRILNRVSPAAMERGRLWQVHRPLNIEAMQEAADILLGQHDFSTFRDSECQAKSPIRTVNRLDVSARPYDGAGGREILIHAEGRSFLHHQVRNMAGTLKLVGDGKWTIDDFRAAFAARDRRRGGPTAPAGGLSLIRVDY